MKRDTLAIASIGLICTLVVAFYFVSASPSKADQQKTSDLTATQNALRTYYTDHQHLPKTLGELQLQPSLTARLSHYSYTYDQKGYTLCATFARASTRPHNAYTEDSNPLFHHKGFQCFTTSLKDIDRAY